MSAQLPAVILSGGQCPLTLRAWCIPHRYFPNPLGIVTPFVILSDSEESPSTTPPVIPSNARNPSPKKAETFFRTTGEWELGDTQGERLACGSTRHPVAVPGVRLADGAAALHTDRCHSLRSLLLPLAALPSLPLAPASLVTFLPEQESYPPEATQPSTPYHAIRRRRILRRASPPQNDTTIDSPPVCPKQSVTQCQRALPAHRGAPG